MLSKSAYLLRLLVTSLALAGLTTSLQAQDAKPWRHGILEAKSDAGFIMMADKGGFAQKRGLKIETLQMKAGSTVMKALIAGELDSVEMGAAEAIVAAARGADIKIVGCTWPGLPQIVMAKAEIRTPAELKGRTIAISTPGSLPDLLGRAVLASYRIPADDVKFASMGADLDRYKSLVAGITDAAVVSNEFQPVMPKNLHVLVKAQDAVPDFIRLCLTVNGKTLAARRDDTIRFVAAQIDAMRYAIGHRAEAVKLTRATISAKADDPRPEFIFDQAVQNRQVDPTLAIPAAKLEWMQAQFVRSGTLPKAAEVARMIDADVREKALALAGAGPGQ
jgi:NitT/TauT family transport system substrate-binding protein